MDSFIQPAFIIAYQLRLGTIHGHEKKETKISACILVEKQDNKYISNQTSKSDGKCLEKIKQRNADCMGWGVAAKVNIVIRVGVTEKSHPSKGERVKRACVQGTRDQREGTARAKVLRQAHAWQV